MSKAGTVVVVLAVLALLGGCKDSTSDSGLPFGAKTGGATNAPAAGAGGSGGVATEQSVTTTPSSSTEESTTTEPTEPPLSAAAMDRTFQVYMNGLLNHDMTALHSATCPKLRSTEVGFELNGNYVSKWAELPYGFGPGEDYVTVQAKVSLRNPSTGASAGTKTYSWYIERDEAMDYWVCGFLS